MNTTLAFYDNKLSLVRFADRDALGISTEDMYLLRQIEFDDKRPLTLEQIASNKCEVAMLYGFMNNNPSMLIKDDITVMQVYEGRNSNNYLLFAKDNNHSVVRDTPQADAINYLHEYTDFRTNDQSNWVRISVPRELAGNITQFYNAETRETTPFKLSNVLREIGLGTSNEESELLAKLNLLYLYSNTEIYGEALDESVSPNTFVGANFNRDRDWSNNQGKDYFFVLPKQGEIANIEWVVFDGLEDLKNGYGNFQSYFVFSAPADTARNGDACW